MGHGVATTASILAAMSLANAGELTGELDVWGRWYTPDHNSIIEISDCGDGTPCGIVTWVDQHDGMVDDTRNPDPTLQGQPMVGVKLLHGFKAEKHRWASGAIYNPENGKTYRARIALTPENTLAVSGCLGPICKKLFWERAEKGTVAAVSTDFSSEVEPTSLN